MTFPPKTIILPANWSQSRDGQLIQFIVVHDTERPSDNGNSISYLQRGGELPDGSDRKVSIHVLVEPDAVCYRMVNDEMGANHAGYGTIKINGRTYGPNQHYNINDVSLGIELEHTKNSSAPYPDAQLMAMGYIINVWRNKYGKLPIYLHREVDSTRRSDPIHLDTPTIERWVGMAARLMQQIPTPGSPINHRFIVPQVVYTDRKHGSPFATVDGTPNGDPLVMPKDRIVPIGDLTNGWAWIATGVGFVPYDTLVGV